MSLTKTNSEILNQLLSGQDLDAETSNTLMKRWLNDEILDVQTGAFLSALRAKGASLINDLCQAGANKKVIPI